MRRRLGTIAILVAWFFFGCGQWQTCPAKGEPCDPKACTEPYICTACGCRYWGHRDGPGAGDIDHEGSDPSQTPSR